MGRGGSIGSFFGHISKMKYAHFLKKMGILQMGIFKNFQKNGHIVNGHMPKYAHLNFTSKNFNTKLPQ